MAGRMRVLCRVLTLGLCVSVAASVGCLDASEPGNLVPATVVEDPSLPRARWNGASFHIEELGPEGAPVLIFLHGGPGDDYQYLLPLADRHDGVSLADEHRLVFWDQRSAGLSERFSAPEALSLENHLRDLEQLVERVAGERQVVLVGHSWGGQYAALYMSAHPERVAGVVLLEPGEFSTELGKLVPGFAPDLTAEWVNDWAWARQLLATDDHARADFALTVGLLAENSQPGRNDRPVPSWRTGVASKVHVYLAQLSERSFDFTANLDRVQPEVLFIVGGATEDLGAAFQEKQRVLFRRSRLEVIPDAGHNDIVYWRAAESVALIRDYLRTLDLEGAR
ncbi:alpha/beta fold hydrolase [Archangium lipolyticum]|uniref:alpha/beta fold hydrolase n=1 Tax=Archangium lipolyticum TaxID=2970465 RepID=UPI002149D07B|nr:alpha/beta hydrolase [Archangium lipolyticum]